MFRPGPLAIWAIALLCSVAVAQPPPPLLNRTVFWGKAPQPDLQTVLIWQLDEEAAPRPEDLDAQVVGMLTESPEDPTSAGVPGAASAIAATGCELKGDARYDRDGRFLGGVRLSGKGAVQSEAIDLIGIVRERRAATVDFWIRPDEAAGDACLLALPSFNPAMPLAIARSRDGAVRLTGSDGPLITHSNRAPSGLWTHVALVLSSASARLLLNGSPADVPPAEAANLARSIASVAAKTFTIGSDAGGERGFSGLVDAVRVSRGERLFFERKDLSWCDPGARRTLETKPPWFARGRPLNVRCSFDRTLKPEEFSGVASEGAATDSTFAEGVRGMALSIAAPAVTNFALAGRAALPLDRGSIEFWFMPQGWDNEFVGDEFGTDIPWMPVLRFARQGTPPSRGLRILRLARGRSRPDVRYQRPWVPFHPGTWTHVVCAWDGAVTSVYLDGRPQAIGQVAFGGPLHADDQKAYEAWLKASGDADDGSYRIVFEPSETLIDELRVYPWPLAPGEAGNAYARYFPDGGSRLVELPRLLATTSYDFYQKIVSMQVSCQPVDDVEPSYAVVRLLRRGAGEPLYAADKIVLDASLKGGAGGHRTLDFGEYTVEVESHAADGKLLKAAPFDWSRKKPEWWQNDLGKAPVVPKPWTPVRADGSAAGVWGREYRFGGGGLVTSLVSAAAEVLAAPPRLRARIGGTDVEFSGPPAAPGERSDAAASWQGELRAAGVKASVRAHLEYDGLLGYTISLRPDGTATADVESLTLDFPLRREVATQYIINGGGHNFRASWVARMIPEETNAVWSGWTAPGHKGVAAGSFCPIVWIGDDRRGLCFFGENDRGWTPRGGKPAQEIFRDGNRIVYRMNVISAPVKIGPAREFAFYIHPTPTKPLPPDWRKLNARGAGGPGVVRDGVDAFLGHTLTAPAGIFNAGITFAVEPVSWDDAARNAAQLRAKIGRDSPVMFYIDCSWPQLGPTMAELKPTLWWTGRMTWSREVEDYFVWAVNEYIRRGIIDGLYIDDVSCNSTRALDSGAYLLDDGQTQPGFSTLGFRRFLQRVWVLFEQAGKRPIILPHTTYCFEIPALSFAECTVNGEDRDIKPFAAHTYPDVWSPEELRVMGSSEKWGFVTFWKPGVRADFDYRFDPKARAWIHRQSRAMHALVVPHDYWYLWTWPTANCIRPALAKFGADDPSVRFVPYWDLDGAASVTGQRMLLSVFSRPDAALLMVSNLAKEDQDVIVAADPRRVFGSAGSSGMTWEDIDTSLAPPRTGQATKEEMAGAERRMLRDEEDDIREWTRPSDALVADFLDGRQADEKEADRLRIRPEGTTVRALVRKQDYRLLLLRPRAGDRPASGR